MSNKLITYNILVQIIGKALIFVILIASTAIIAKGLGPEKYGYYTIIFVYLSFAAVLIDLGLQTIAVRESSRDENDTATIAGNLFWLKVIWGGFILTISSILFSYLNFIKIINNGVMMFNLTLSY